ncbi:oxidoreductase [Alphaproteobacteria bacterium]|nr:oxidoreductase [Alphaproteobacteria bacterium]
MDTTTGSSLLTNLDHIVLIGGGRWARVLLGVLCKIAPQHIKISAHSPHNAQQMSAWVDKCDLNKRVKVSRRYPVIKTKERASVVIANAARDHEKAIRWALSNGLPTLVEKPVTLTSKNTRGVANMAIRNNTYLAAAHVFTFATYVETFFQTISRSKIVRSISVKWTDPSSEQRYGESKSYDPSLTVFADWLPHIVPILDGIVPHSSSSVEKLEISSGGAVIKTDIFLGNVPCEIKLERNAKNRERLINVETDIGLISLDFATEPGSVSCGSLVYNGLSEWANCPKPVNKMLRSFLLGAAGGVPDKRLDIELAMRANQLIDEMSPLYAAKLGLWLDERMPRIDSELTPDFKYALSEIVSMEDSSRTVPTETKVHYLFSEMTKCSFINSQQKFSKNPIEYIKCLITAGRGMSYCVKGSFNG